MTRKRLYYSYIVCLALLLMAAAAGADAVGLEAAAVDGGPVGGAGSMAAGVVQAGNAPEESLRLRILAHSNTVADQWVKKRVKEAVVPELERWLREARDAHEARRRVAERLDDIQALADDVLREHGFLYRSRVTLGEVAFPATTFMNRQFPPGQYEALRITLGDGRGDNFWCIMFPPFCFGSVAEPWGGAPAESVPAGLPVEQHGGHPADDAGADAASPKLEVEMRIFLLDWLREWLS